MFCFYFVVFGFLKKLTDLSAQVLVIFCLFISVNDTLSEPIKKKNKLAWKFFIRTEKRNTNVYNM